MKKDGKTLKIEYFDGKLTHSIKGEGADALDDYRKICFLLLGKDIDEYECMLSPFLGKEYKTTDMTQKQKVLLSIAKHHPDSWVKSQDLLEEYMEDYDGQLELSAYSTNLSRLHASGFLEMKGSRAQREYRIIKSQFPVIEDTFERYLVTDI